MESFDSILAIIVEKIKSGELFISLSPYFDVSFEPIDEGFIKITSKKLNISEKDFREQISSIESMLLQELEDNLENYVNSRIKHDIEAEHITKDKEDQRRKQLEEQAKKIKEKLANERLKQRYKLKTMSKAPFFTGIDWDVKLKTSDDSGKDIKFAYATCKIKFQREFQWEPHLLLGGRAFDSVQINLSKEDLQHLLHTLQIILTNLNKLETEYNIPQN